MAVVAYDGCFTRKPNGEVIGGPHWQAGIDRGLVSALGKELARATNYEDKAKLANRSASGRVSAEVPVKTAQLSPPILAAVHPAQRRQVENGTFHSTTINVQLTAAELRALAFGLRSHAQSIESKYRPRLQDGIPSSAAQTLLERERPEIEKRAIAAALTMFGGDVRDARAYLTAAYPVRP